MKRYFAKRAEGDLADTQKIVAVVGHADKVRKAFVRTLKMDQRYKMPLFFGALQNLLKELGKRGYTVKPDGFHVTGGRFVKFEGMSRAQIFGKFASVQQAVAKWVWKVTESDEELWMKMVEEDLVFRANELDAVMALLFELFDHNGYLAYDYEERGFDAFEQRLLLCLTK